MTDTFAVLRINSSLRTLHNIGVLTSHIKVQLSSRNMYHVKNQSIGGKYICLLYTNYILLLKRVEGSRSALIF
jgi:hypothetical protein